MELRFVAFSDVHLHNFSQFSKINEDKLNTRLVDSIHVINQIKNYCKNNGIEITIFCGDWFNNGSSLSPDIIAVTNYLLKDFPGKLYMIAGQHDYLWKDGKWNAVQAISIPFDNANYVPDKISNNLMNIYVCQNVSPLEKQKEELKKIDEIFTIREDDKYDIFIGHFLVKELIEKGSLRIPGNKVVSYEDLPKGFDLYLFGDYHEYVWLPDLKLLSVGSTHQHEFSPLLENRDLGGFVDIKIDDKEITCNRVALEAPKFVNLPSKDVLVETTLNKDYFYRIYCENQDEVESIKSSYGDLYNMTFVVDKKDDMTNEKRMDVKISHDPKDIMERYVDYMNADKNLINIGLEYLQKVK